MRIKTGLKAGDEGAALTTDNAPALFEAAIEGSGVPQAIEDLQKKVASFEQKAQNRSVAKADFWVDEDTMHAGIPECRRKRVAEKTKAVFSAHRKDDEVFPMHNAARYLAAQALSSVSKLSDTARNYIGVDRPMSGAEMAARRYGPEHPVTQVMNGDYSAFTVSDDLLDSDKPSRIGATIPRVLLPDVEKFLRHKSVVLAAGPVNIPLESGEADWVTMTNGAAAGYVDSPTSVPPRTSLDFAVSSFKARHLKALMVASITALMRSDVVGEAFLASELGEAGGDAIDEAILLSPGTDAAPKGLRYLVNSDNVAAATVIADSDSMATRIHNISLDFRSRFNQVVSVKKVTPQRFAIFMPYREYLYFLDARTNDGSLAWPSVDRNGTMYGWPIFWTGRIPTTETTPANIGTTIICADMAKCGFATERPIEIDTSFEASVTDTSGNFNLWERRCVGVQLYASHDFRMLRDTAGWVLTGANYGGIDATG